jgi:hypothetical protein
MIRIQIIVLEVDGKVRLRAEGSDDPNYPPATPKEADVANKVSVGLVGLMEDLDPDLKQLGPATIRTTIPPI